MIGPFLSMSYIDNTKKRLVDGKSLCKRSKILRLPQEPDLDHLLRKLVQADIDVHHDRPMTAVGIYGSDVITNRCLQIRSSF